MEGKEKMNYYLFYGTLRDGCYNNTNFSLKENGKRIGYVSLDKFDMYTNGYYPMVIPGKGTIECELWGIDNEQIENSIRQMERLAGYIEHRINIILDEETEYIATLFVYIYDVSNLTKISEGDWNEFKKRSI